MCSVLLAITSYILQLLLSLAVSRDLSLPGLCKDILNDKTVLNAIVRMDAHHEGYLKSGGSSTRN